MNEWKKERREKSKAGNFYPQLCKDKYLEKTFLEAPHFDFIGKGKKKHLAQPIPG